MNEFEGALMLTGLLCSTGLVVYIIHVVRCIIMRPPAGTPLAGTSEPAELREEVRQLRAQNPERVLELDTMLERLERRITRLEESRHEVMAGRRD